MNINCLEYNYTHTLKDGEGWIIYLISFPFYKIWLNPKWLLNTYLYLSSDCNHYYCGEAQNIHADSMVNEINFQLKLFLLPIIVFLCWIIVVSGISKGTSNGLET